MALDARYEIDGLRRLPPARPVHRGPPATSTTPPTRLSGSPGRSEKDDYRGRSITALMEGFAPGSESSLSRAGGGGSMKNMDARWPRASRSRTSGYQRQPRPPQGLPAARIILSQPDRRLLLGASASRQPGAVPQRARIGQGLHGRAADRPGREPAGRQRGGTAMRHRAAGQRSFPPRSKPTAGPLPLEPRARLRAQIDGLTRPRPAAAGESPPHGPNRFRDGQGGTVCWTKPCCRTGASKVC